MPEQPADFNPNKRPISPGYADIIARIQKPWGIEQLTRGELPDIKLARLQSEKEVRLEAALRLIYFAEQIFHNSPEQVHRLMNDIITLNDRTQLEIRKINGQVVVKKEKLNPKHNYEGEI